MAGSDYGAGEWFNMIELKNLSKVYTLKGVKKVILENVSFRFPEDKNIAIIGRNGAGKSTLMRLISGVEEPSKGHIKKNVKISWPLGFAGGFNGSMTGLENVRFISRVYGQDTEKTIEFVEEFSELGPSLKLPIQTYSSGMKARLAFGLSMAIDFDCYLIDEVMSVGDQQFKKKSQEVFSQKLKNANIIMVSHSMHLIKTYCGCGVILDQGKLAYFDNVSLLIEAYENKL